MTGFQTEIKVKSYFEIYCILPILKHVLKPRCMIKCRCRLFMIQSVKHMLDDSNNIFTKMLLTQQLKQNNNKIWIQNHDYKFGRGLHMLMRSNQLPKIDQNVIQTILKYWSQTYRNTAKHTSNVQSHTFCFLACLTNWDKYQRNFYSYTENNKL